MRCTITYTGRAASKKAAKVKRNTSASLRRNGRTYARGTVGKLEATRKLARGRYTLRVGKGRSATQFAVTVRR